MNMLKIFLGLMALVILPSATYANGYRPLSEEFQQREEQEARETQKLNEEERQEEQEFNQNVEDTSDLYDYERVEDLDDFSREQYVEPE
jgi:hypothetical protein